MSDTTDHTAPGRRLIEESFPLKKVSEDSKHEKTVRHGHISTLHLWPARRPLAASRAALLAALLPDPGNDVARAALNKRIELLTRWTTENGPELAKFRTEIRKAYGGQPPRVLDMFAGGGAIPFEAMRLGCDVTAVDFNPVAWFLLRCTLEYPQRFAGKSWPIPRRLERYLDGASDTMNGGGKTKMRGAKASTAAHQSLVSAPWMEDHARVGNLAEHVRAWGGWVLAHARRELRDIYPAVDGQMPLTYLWARTVPCPDPQCGTQVPLLKTLWLSKAANHRVAMRIVAENEPHQSVRFEIWEPGPHDEVGHGTMSTTGTPKATCPRCGTLLSTEYLRDQMPQGRMNAQMMAVVAGGDDGKIYRLPTSKDEDAAKVATQRLNCVEARVPGGRPHEPISPAYLSSRHQAAFIINYGLDHYNLIFTDRSTLALLTFIHWAQQARRAMEKFGYAPEAIEAIAAYLALVVDRIADYGSSIAHWNVVGQKIGNTFSGFRLAMAWDFTEVNPVVKTSGGYIGQLNWVAKFAEHALLATSATETAPNVRHGSATDLPDSQAYDAIITDPPYYDAVPYADISDFFYVWLKRSLDGQGGEAFATEVVPKQGELISNAGLFDKDERAAKQFYEDGMAQAFGKAYQALKPDGVFVIVFAHKDVQAWETLVSAMIRAGWTVTASWPIDTEMGNRTRALNSAALASSIWLVCRKRPENAGIGRYGDVMRRMQERITERLRAFWDLGISGPDFVWAAIGPALESYSNYRDVRRLDGSAFTVGEFLREVRRLVTDFALGQILHGASTGELDETTRYYLMHRHSFGMGPAPIGECLLLAGGYGLNLDELRGPRGILTKANAPKKAAAEDEDAEAADGDGEAVAPKASGNDLRLLSYDERTRADLGEPLPNGSLPMIDMLHRLMRLWATGQLDAV
ncbi:MAG TPA: DUF1156 domain-containing protein, partial [Ktedonobacterales bacterium]|nr:DUF1156 domain-containing protein [Ktedonobacterales bacterium]